MPLPGAESAVMRVPLRSLCGSGKWQTCVPAGCWVGAAHLEAPPWPWALRWVPWPTSQPLPVLPTPGTAWHRRGRVPALRHPFPARPWVCCAPVPTCPPPSSPPGATQREEKSLGAGAQSATLSNLRPDTEYVVTLRPRYAQQPALPSTLTTRTRKHRASPRLSWRQGWVPSRGVPDQPPCPVGMALLPHRCLVGAGLGWGCR